MGSPVPEILKALDTITGDQDTLDRVRELLARFAAPATQKAQRVRVAAAMLRSGTSRRDAAFALRERYGVSRKTSYRDLEAVLCQNRPPSDTTRA